MTITAVKKVRIIANGISPINKVVISNAISLVWIMFRVFKVFLINLTAEPCGKIGRSSFAAIFKRFVIR